jgi:hypothetical protein
MGVVCDFDLRGGEKSFLPKPAGASVNLISLGIFLQHIFDSGYSDEMKSIYSALANEKNIQYIYIHSGLDRTGTTCYILGTVEFR